MYQLVFFVVTSLWVLLSASLTWAAYDYQMQTVADPIKLGLVKSSIAAFSLVLSVPAGWLSDMAGPAKRFLLMLFWLSTGTAAFAFGAWTGGATLQKMIIYLIMAKVSENWEGVAVACVADRTPAFTQERSMWMGFFYGGYGAGIYLGPQMSRRLYTWYGFGFVEFAITSCILSGLFVIISYAGSGFMMRGFTDDQAPSKSDDKPAQQLDFKVAYQVLRDSPPLVCLLVMRLLWVLQFGLGVNTMGMMVKQGVGADEDDLAWLISYMGLSFALFQALFVPFVTGLGFSAISTLFVCQFIEASGRLLTVYLATSVEGVLAGYVYYLMGTSLFVPLFSSLVTSYSPEEATSTVLGVGRALGCVADIISPTLGGWLVEKYSPFAPMVCASALLFLGYVPLSLFALFSKRTDTVKDKSQ